MIVLSLGLASCGGDAKAAAGDCTGDCATCSSMEGKDGEACEGCDGCDDMKLEDVTPAPSDADAKKTDIPKAPDAGK